MIFTYSKLTPEHKIGAFDCGDADLNDYVINAALDHQKELLAVTYIIFDSTDEIIGFFSVFNDKISHTDLTSINAWKKIKQILPRGKGYKSYPAIKIGRLGISAKHQKNGLGTKIIDFIKIWFSEENKTGCRFITVDAYSDSISFYQKNGFKFLTTKDEQEDTRQMYFNLGQLIVDSKL
jgi:GNAT superfamily N-acetyltransferase